MLRGGMPTLHFPALSFFFLSVFPHSIRLAFVYTFKAGLFVLFAVFPYFLQKRHRVFSRSGHIRPPVQNQIKTKRFESFGGTLRKLLAKFPLETRKITL